MGDNREYSDKIIETSDVNREIQKNFEDKAVEDPCSAKTKKTSSLFSYR